MKRFNVLLHSLVFFLCSYSRLTPDNFAKITEGMTEQEVRSILGKPQNLDSSSMLGLLSGTVYKYSQGQKKSQLLFSMVK